MWNARRIRDLYERCAEVGFRYQEIGKAESILRDLELLARDRDPLLDVRYNEALIAKVLR